MIFKLGTFNVNNLFSRYNFRIEAEIEGLPEGSIEFSKARKLVTSLDERTVEYKGRALKHKTPDGRLAVAQRIMHMDLDVIALQEVEDIETLRYFARHELSDETLYPYLILLEGNDPRLIDLAVMSKYPIGAVTTWQHTVHPKMPGARVFSRDVLQVDILDHSRKNKLLTVFNNHLKSHFVPFTEDQEQGAKQANERRRLQAEMLALIIEDQMRPDSSYAVLGDMNDDVTSAFLRPITDNDDLQLVNGLATAAETQAPPPSASAPSTQLWTHRYKPSGEPAHYTLFDHIWLSPSLATKQTGAFIHRRSKMGGDGSDHDPAWVELDI